MASLKAFIEAHGDEILEPYLNLVKHSITRYATSDPGTFPANTRRMLEILPLATSESGAVRVQEYIESLVRERLPAGFQLTDIVEAMFMYNDVIGPLIDRYETDPAAQRELRDALYEATRNVGLRFAKTFVDLQLKLIEQQRRAVLELSTPVITVWDGILALPLIGTIDSYRARQITEELLSAVASERAKIVLIDITGVPVVDTNVADHLIKTIRAAELLGTQCMLVGIGPELAQTVVALGVDLRSITSTAHMRQGLTLAFRKLGLTVRPTDAVT